MFSKTASLAVCALAMACSGAGQELPPAHSKAAEACVGGRVRSDAELSRYGVCDRISGDLQITGVSTLSALSHLQSVTGSLSVAHTAGLSSLVGLEHLESVSSLALIDNRNLDDIGQLSKLRAAVEIAIVQSPALRSLDGLSGLSTLDRLTLRATGLYTLSGTDKLTRVRALELKNNPKLINAGALNGLADVDELVVQDNPRLCARFGFFDSLQPTTLFILSGNFGVARSELAHFEGRQQRPGLPSPTHAGAFTDSSWSSRTVTGVRAAQSAGIAQRGDGLGVVLNGKSN